MSIPSRTDLVDLPTVMRKLRESLSAAMEQGDDERIKFDVDKIDVELQVVVESAGTGEVGVDFLGVVKFGGGLNEKDASVQKLTFSLTPRDTKAKADAEDDSDQAKTSGKVSIRGKV